MRYLDSKVKHLNVDSANVCDRMLADQGQEC
jgi:hypothetical protein